MAAFIKEQDHVDLKNFEVIISDMGESFEVVFVPNTDPEQPGLKGGRNKYGREIHYRVSKEKYEIIGKSYAR